MSARETVLATLRRSLHADADDAARRRAVEERLATAPKGLIPARAQLPRDGQVALFMEMAEAVDATVERIADPADLPVRVAAYLRERNLPQQVVRGRDPLFAEMPWDGQPQLEIRAGPADGTEQAGLSRAFGGVAETGTLVMASGPDNPTTINFLPEHHIVALRAEDVAGDYETVLARIRETYGKGGMPRVVNMITGPSRSADIEQKLLLGAHGPRRLHVIIVG